MKHNKHAISAAFISTVLSSASAYADSPENIVAKTVPAREAIMPDVSVTMGAGMADTARYVGSDERRYLFMPTFNAMWKNGWFAGFPRGIGYNFSSVPYMGYGLRLTGDYGRKENRSAALHGLGDLAARAELGGFLHMALSRSVRVSTSVRYDLANEQQGALLELGVSYRTPLTENQSLSLGLATTYANSNYMQRHFGVDAMQSAASGYGVYTPGAGIREVDLTTNYSYKIDQHWAIVTGATFGRLGSVARGAPMTRSGQHNSAYVLTNYTF